MYNKYSDKDSNIVICNKLYLVLFCNHDEIRRQKNYTYKT